MYSVILCGGSGTRLWPLSRKNFPKQFLSLYSDKSLLEETYLRMKKIMPLKNIFLITNQENFFNVFNQIKGIERNFRKEQILIEPESLNTAPAITYAVKYLNEIVKIGNESPIIFLPSDHYIGNEPAYLELVKKAMRKAGDKIITIGIMPAGPATGFGYIKKGKKIDGCFQVNAFEEKPDEKTARKYVQSGRYVWNSGMYIFSVKTFKKELKEHASPFYSLMEKSMEEFLSKFKILPKISFDYAISEKTKNIAVFEGDFGWSDIGSFDDLAEILSKKGISRGKHVNIDSQNVFIHSAGDKLIATSGVSDLIIVEAIDSILVQRKGAGENARKIVDRLKEKKHKEVEHNLVVHRPWGKYEILIERAANYKVKKITVSPGAKLSLQSHDYRAEHWVVVKGKAKIVNGRKNIILKENESTFIPAKTKHRLENPGRTDLEIIEVQTGEYIEENDIKRYDDVYERA